jgi:tetraacyldisaccharide 4'-kinase
MAQRRQVQPPAGLGDRLVADWYRPRLTPLTVLLTPLALLFGVVAGTRRALYRQGLLRSRRLPVPVIVIGNISVGGVGKTPLTIALAQALAQRGFRPGIVSRGYGGTNRMPSAVQVPDDASRVGDEALVLAASGFPVWVGHRRADVARALLAAHPECNVILSDDGLQHYALARTMEIAVIDVARGVGNGWLLPAGPLREPASRLREVDAVVRLVAGDAVQSATAGARETTMRHVPLPWRNLLHPEWTADPAAWRNGEVRAVSGIGHPQRFFDMLASMGIAATAHPLPDHHRFTAADLAFPDAAAILMTEKDAVKCRAFADDRCWYLPLQAVIDPLLVSAVEGKIHGFETPRDARVPGDQGPAGL